MASAAEQLAANMNFDAFSKASELHKRLWFTLIALVVYRLGTYIAIPGIDVLAFGKAFEGQSKGILGMFDMFSGGAVARMAIFSLNVMPYISASIIVQLMQTVYPPWEKLKKEGGEAGRKQLNQYTRYLTVLLAIFQSFGIAVGLSNSQGVVDTPGLFFVLTTVTTLTTGTMFLMWLGEQITARGVGNGISLIIMAGIVARVVPAAGQLLQSAQSGNVSGFLLFMIAASVIGVIVFVVFMERAQRRLLILYPKRQMGNRMFGGESNYLPLKINTAGVIPPIFASSLLLMPVSVLNFIPITRMPYWLQGPVTLLQSQLQHGQPTFVILYGLMIVGFSFFYTSIVFNPDDTAENLRKYGGNLPGIRPGKRTAEYIDHVLTRLTVIGAAYITAVCLLPEFVIASSPTISSSTSYFGGTSVLIVVTVTMDTVAQISSHLYAHQYEGLIRKSRLRGAKR
jgi:preprotein translocase subunit SecY